MAEYNSTRVFSWYHFHCAISQQHMTSLPKDKAAFGTKHDFGEMPVADRAADAAGGVTEPR